MFFSCQEVGEEDGTSHRGRGRGDGGGDDAVNYTGNVHFIFCYSLSVSSLSTRNPRRHHNYGFNKKNIRQAAILPLIVIIPPDRLKSILSMYRTSGGLAFVAI